MVAPVAKAGMLFNVNRFFDNFNLLNNAGIIFNLLKFTAAIRTGIKGMSLKVINVVFCERRSFVFAVSGLTANVTRPAVFLLSRRLGNIRRRRLGRVGRILREFGNLVSEFFHQFSELSDLFFKFSDALNIELFFFRSQALSSRFPTRLLSDKFGVLLEKDVDMPP